MQTFLLAEIIKVSGLLPDALLDVIRHHSIEPRWQDILMPPGKFNAFLLWIILPSLCSEVTATIVAYAELK